jgi:hypothetical protein
VTLLSRIQWRLFAFRQRRWRDDTKWSRRVERDWELAQVRLSRDDLEVIDGVRASVGGLGLRLLVVFGSVARGSSTASSDLDVYFEADLLPEPFNRTDPAHRWQVFGLPSGAFVTALEVGQFFAFEIARDGLVLDGEDLFRSALLKIADRQLVPAVGASD